MKPNGTQHLQVLYNISQNYLIYYIESRKMDNPVKGARTSTKAKKDYTASD
jgi:hypothetical protein